MGGDDYCGTCGSTRKACAQCADLVRGAVRDAVDLLEAAPVLTPDHHKRLFYLLSGVLT